MLANKCLIKGKTFYFKDFHSTNFHAGDLLFSAHNLFSIFLPGVNQSFMEAFQYL
jgi:hypothetical protein